MQVRDTISNTGIDISTVEPEFSFLQNLQPSRQRPELWNDLGSSKSRSTVQEEEARTMVEGIMMEAGNDVIFGFTDGPVTWCRRVYLLRTTVRLCHSELKRVQSVDQTDKKERQASYAGSIQRRARARNEIILKPKQKLQPLPPLDTARTVGKFQNEQMRRYLMQTDQPAGAKLLRVAVLGAPNAGKSTLVNNLINWKVNPVSTKVHTTRKNALAVVTEGDTQLIFTDTPGVIIKREARKHNCRELYRIPRNSVEEEVDLVGVVVDASNKFTRESIHRELLKILNYSKHIPSVLILNKVDMLQNKDVLLGVIRTLTDGVVDRKKVRAAPVRKKPKTKKDFKEIYKELVAKHGKLKIKKKTGPAKRDPGKVVPPLASEIDTTNKTMKQIFNEIKESPNNDALEFSKNHQYDSVVSDLDVDSCDASKSIEQTNSVTMFEALSDNQGDSEHSESSDNSVSQIERLETVKSENGLADSKSYVHTNSNNNNTLSKDSVESNTKNSGSRKDQKSVNSKSLKNEKNTSLDTDTNRQLTNMKIDKTDTDNSDNKQSELESNADEHSLNKEDVDSEKSYWDDLMPWDQEIPKGWPHFNRVFIVSSTDGDGMDDLKTYLLDSAKKGDWVYHSSLVTDENPQELARQIVWSKLLDGVPGYLAYSMIPDIVFWDTDEHGTLKIFMNVYASSVGSMIGKSGNRIAQISEHSTQALMDAFRCEVRLKLCVKKLYKKDKR